MAQVLRIQDERIRPAGPRQRSVGLEPTVSRCALRILLTVPAAMGVWSLFCFMGAMAGCENVQTAGRGLITALTGV